MIVENKPQKVYSSVLLKAINGFDQVKFSIFSTLYGKINLKTIGLGGKKSFSRLKVSRLILPDSIEEIDDEAFYWMWYNDNDKGVDRVLILPKNIKKIGKKAFYCNDFEKIYIPSTVEEVGEDAFGSTGGNRLNGKIYYKGPLDTSTWDTSRNSFKIITDFDEEEFLNENS